MLDAHLRGYDSPLLLDRLRINGRAGAAGDDQRRAAEEELVDTVGVAVLGQLLEIEDFAHAQAHGRDHHPVPGLVRLGGLVRPHLDAPGVGADRGDLLVLAPVAVLELDPGRIAAGIAAPLLLLQASLHLAGADDDEVAAADRDVLVLGALVELVVGDGFSILQPVDAAEAGDVEEHATTDHLVLGVLDAEHTQAPGVDQLGVEAVIGLVLVEDVPQRVPMGGTLDAEIERIVGVADLVPVLSAGDGVGAGREHLVDGIEAAAEQAGLGAFAVEGDAEREYLAGTDQARRLDDILGRYVIERANLIVLAPAAPVLELLRGLGDRLLAHLDIHRSSLPMLISRSIPKGRAQGPIAPAAIPGRPRRDCEPREALRLFGKNHDYPRRASSVLWVRLSSMAAHGHHR